MKCTTAMRPCVKLLSPPVNIVNVFAPPSDYAGITVPFICVNNGTLCDSTPRAALRRRAITVRIRPICCIKVAPPAACASVATGRSTRCVIMSSREESLRLNRMYRRCSRPRPWYRIHSMIHLVLSVVGHLIDKDRAPSPRRHGQGHGVYVLEDPQGQGLVLEDTSLLMMVHLIICLVVDSAAHLVFAVVQSMIHLVHAWDTRRYTWPRRWNTP